MSTGASGEFVKDGAMGSAEAISVADQFRELAPRYNRLMAPQLYHIQPDQFVFGSIQNDVPKAPPQSNVPLIDCLSNAMIWIA